MTSLSPFKHFQAVILKTDLGPKLKILYENLPDSADGIPASNTNELKDFLITLRPFVSTCHCL